MDLTPILRLNLPAFAFEPWDDEVNDNFDVIDAFVGSVVGFANYAGIWTNATSYTVGQQVIDTADSSFWGCNISHTSAAAPATFLNDRTNHPTYWGLRQNSAKQYAEQAASSAAAAAASAAAAQAAYAAIMPDAPRNDLMYGRINGTWQQAVAIDSPFFTGDPRAPTPPLTDNDNSLATTAFVKGIVGTSAAFVTIGEAPPSSPSIGSLWWDDIGGQLYVYYYDSNSYQWVAVNSATGGMGTGFMPIVGGAFTGPVSFTTGNLTLSSAAITANLHAATKQYVDNTVNNKSYPYLLLSSVPSQTVTSPVAITGTLSVSSTLGVSGAGNFTGNLATSGILSAAQAIPPGMIGGVVNTGYLTLSNALGYNIYYNNSSSQWAYRGAGSGILWYGDTSVGASSPSLVAYLATPNGSPGATAPISEKFRIQPTVVTSQVDFNCLGSVWATNRSGGFGLQQFAASSYGIRFSTDGWRLQFEATTGSLTYYDYHSPAWNLFSIDGGGAVYARGQIASDGVIYGAGGVRFGWQNNWEYGAYVEPGSINHMMVHRAGYYEYWTNVNGESHWVKDNADVMSLVGGTLNVRDKFNTGGTVQGGWVYSTGQVRADADFYSPSGALNIGGNANCNAAFAPNGFFAGGAGDTDIGIYRSGADRIHQMRGNWYWRNRTNGDNVWYAGGNIFFGMYWSGVHPSGYDKMCFSTWFMGAYQFISISPGSSLVARAVSTRHGLAAIMQLNAGEYQREPTPATDDAPEIVHPVEIRLTPERVLEAIPEAGRRGEGGEIGIDITAVLAVAVNAIKELGARVVALEARSGA